MDRSKNSFPSRISSLPISFIFNAALLVIFLLDKARAKLRLGTRKEVRHARC
jgi:hypothetical protein